MQRFRGLAVIAAVVLITTTFFRPSIGHAVPYMESPDAGGTLGTAQTIVGGPYDYLENTLSTISDLADAFLFGWEGGDMAVATSCDGCGISYTTSVYDSAQTFLFSVGIDLAPAPFVPLAAGNYYFLFESPTLMDDTTFTVHTILFNGHDIDGQPVWVGLAAPVPEPATLALLGGGFLAYGFLARRRRNGSSRRM